jgi:hypothetical protein
LDGNGQPTTVAEAGLFAFDIDYDAAGNIMGSVPGSLTFAKDLSSELQIGENGFNSDSEVAGHSWSPTTQAFTFGVRHWDRELDWDQEEVWVMDLDQPDDSYLLSTDNGAGWPEWSPDGTKIGYVMSNGTVIYDLERDRSRLLGRTPSTAWGISHWSPDGSEFVISHWDNWKPGYDAIYRLTEKLGGKTLLVDDDSLCEPTNFCTLITLGWRDVPAMTAGLASVPEPATATVLLVGLATFLGLSRRRGLYGCLDKPT